MIAAVLSGAFVVACLIWFGTYIVQAGAVVVAFAVRLLWLVGGALFTVCAALVWCLWWLVNRRAAMASLRRAQEARERPPGGPPL